MSQRIELKRFRRWTGVLLLLALAAPLLLAPQAHAQRGGFSSLFRPMSVEDLRSMSEDLEL